MLREIRWVKQAKQKNERFSVSQVSQAIGRSEGSITGFCSRNGISTKGGLTIDQIIMCIDAPEGSKSMDWKAVQRIHELLHGHGYDMVETGTTLKKDTLGI